MKAKRNCSESLSLPMSGYSVCLNKWPSQGELLVSSQEHQRQTMQPCQRARFPFTWRTPFSLSKAWCIQALPNLCNDWSKNVIQTASCLLVTWKTRLSKSVLLPLRVWKTQTSRQGHISFHWSDSKQKSPKSKQCWLIEWRTMMGAGNKDTTQLWSLWQLQRQYIWAEEKESEGNGRGCKGWGWMEQRCWLACCLLGCVFACRERSGEGTGVTRCEGKALSSAPGPWETVQARC